ESEAIEHEREPDLLQVLAIHSRHAPVHDLLFRGRRHDPAARHERRDRAGATLRPGAMSGATGPVIFPVDRSAAGARSPIPVFFAWRLLISHANSRSAPCCRPLPITRRSNSCIAGDIVFSPGVTDITVNPAS